MLFDAGKLMSTHSVMALLDVSDDTVRRLVKRGWLAPPRKYPGGVGVRYKAEDVWRCYLALMANGSSSAPPAPPADSPPPVAPAVPEPEETPGRGPKKPARS